MRGTSLVAAGRCLEMRRARLAVHALSALTAHADCPLQQRWQNEAAIPDRALMALLE